jgi:dienelactone hydrolase
MNSETRNPKSESMTNDETRMKALAFVIRASALIRISGFGFRHWRTRLVLRFVLTIVAAMPLRAAPAPTTQPTPGDAMLEAYFRAQTVQLTERCLSDIHTLDDWQSHRPEYRRQLAEMLGLWPEPPRTDLKPTITGTLDHGDFLVEKLHFQSRPGLYVTANLFRPKSIEGKLPAILYVCGHSPARKDGVAYGNKTAYQHHAAWFARNGYVCLVPDTLEFGEIDGIHHGLYRLDMWDWISRGYTPAGVETWNAIRCLDYLQSRPEVDPQRLGMTGRSGGGAYTWYTAALDERVKVAIPVAGITDLTNHIIDGTIEGHCDCMFMCNTYRWDFPLVAALIAPRPMLLSNSDKDTIFPLSGVERLHARVRDIYKLYKADDKLGLLITEGPHKDTQDLQVPAFRWFNRFLKNDTAPLKDATAEAVFKPEELRVFTVKGEPADALNMAIQETFIPVAREPKVPGSKEVWEAMRGEWMKGLREKVFAGWPQQEQPLAVKPKDGVTSSAGTLVEGYEFNSQEGVPLRLLVCRRRRAPVNSLIIRIANEEKWQKCLQITLLNHVSHDEGWRVAGPTTPITVEDRAEVFRPEDAATIIIAPRGIGPTAWSGDQKKQTQILRRFWLVGQSLDGMRVWDVRRALQAVRELPALDEPLRANATVPITLAADGGMAGVALYASLFEPEIKRLELTNVSASHVDGPNFLNVLKVLDIPAAVAMAAERCEVKITSSEPAGTWDYPLEVARKLGWPAERLVIGK